MSIAWRRHCSARRRGTRCPSGAAASRWREFPAVSPSTHPEPAGFGPAGRCLCGDPAGHVAWFEFPRRRRRSAGNYCAMCSVGAVYGSMTCWGPVPAPETRSAAQQSRMLRREYPARTLTPPAPATRFLPPVWSRALWTGRLIDSCGAGRAAGSRLFMDLRASARPCWPAMVRAVDRGGVGSLADRHHDENNVVWFWPTWWRPSGR